MALDVSRETGARLRHLFGLVVKLCSLGVAGAYLAYLAGINLFLSTTLFDMVIDADPGTLDIHFERGWSVWPGRIHAKNLSVRSRDGSVEWMLHITAVQFDISFPALARRRFQATHVRGSGGSFRLRNRLDPWEVTPERVAGLPPIKGFPAVPVRPYSQCGLSEWSDAHYRLWTIQLDDIHAEALRELWINRYRLEGHTSATGRFYLKPVRSAEVGPLHAEIRESRLSIRDARWVEALDASADFALPQFDPRVRTGTDVLRALSAEVDTQGVVPDVGQLPLPLPPGVRLRGALELRRLGLRFEGGHPLRGSHVEGVGSLITLERRDHQVSSSIAVTGDIEESDERLAFHVVATRARLERAGKTVLVAPRIDLAGTSPRPEVGRGVGHVHLTVDTPDIELPDIRVLSPYSPSSVTLVGGRVRGGVWGEAWPDESRARGRASMQAEDLDVRVSDVRVRGGATALGSIDSFDWRTGRIERPEASVTLRSRMSVASRGPGSGKDFAGDVEAFVVTRGYRPETETVDVSGSGAKLRNLVVSGEPAASSRGEARLDQATLRVDRPLLEGHVSAEATDATPLLASVREHVPAPFRGLLNLPQLTASTRLLADGRRVELSDLEAHGGALHVYGVFAAGQADHLFGAFVVQGGPLTVGVQVDPRGAHVHLFGLSGWLQQEEETVSERFAPPYP
jgi:hypothetical protein